MCGRRRTSCTSTVLVNLETLLVIVPRGTWRNKVVNNVGNLLEQRILRKLRNMRVNTCLGMLLQVAEMKPSEHKHFHNNYGVT